MRQLSTLLAILLLGSASYLSFAQEKVKLKDGKMKTKGETKTAMAADMPMDPFTASYSSNFVMGNKDYSRKLLDIYKDYQNNTMNAHDYFADSIELIFSDGNIIKGKEQMAKALNEFRGTISNIALDIHAWVPLHSVDRNEDVVAIWAQETDTMTDGKTNTSDVHEVWWFNTDGKVYRMRQFSAKMPAMK